MMSDFDRISDELFAYFYSGCSEEILEEALDENNQIVVDKLCEVCKKYCDGWSTLEENGLSWFTWEHMLWIVLEYFSLNGLNDYDDIYYDNVKKVCEINKKLDEKFEVYY